MSYDFDVLGRAGITQGEFAELLSVQRASVNNWMRGRSTPHSLHSDKVKKMLALIKHAVKLKLLPADMPGVYKGRMDVRRDFIRARLAEAADLAGARNRPKARRPKKR